MHDLRLLVTGGTGFIGSQLVLEALRRGHDVAALGLEATPAETRNAEALRRAGAPLVLAPLSDLGTAWSLLEGRDAVVHLAAAQHETNAPDELFWEVNVRATERLLDACAATGVRRLVYSSTMGVYGRGGGAADETTPPNPDNIYGVTKLAAERAILARASEGVVVVVLRIGEVYGPRDPRLLKLFRSFQRGWFPVLGAGRNRHPLLYIDDLVEALLFAAARPEAAGEVLVLAGDEQPTTAELLAAAAAALGQGSPGPRLPLAPFVLAAMAAEATMRPFRLRPPLTRRRLDFFRRDLRLGNAKARRMLGFEPRVGLAEGLARTVAWYRSQGEL